MYSSKDSRPNTSLCVQGLQHVWFSISRSWQSCQNYMPKQELYQNKRYMPNRNPLILLRLTDVFQERQYIWPCHLQQLFCSSTVHSTKRHYRASLSERDFHRHQLLKVHWVELVRELSRRKQITPALKRICNIYQHSQLTTCPPCPRHSRLVWRMTSVEQGAWTMLP